MAAVDYQLNVYAREYIPMEGRNLRNVFGNKTFLINRMLPKARTYKGGDGRVREHIKYRPSPGGFHEQYATFNPVDRANSQPMYQNMRYMEVSVVIDKIELWVLNKGNDGALFNMFTEKLGGAAEDLGIYAEVGVYFGATGTTSFANGVAGLAELANDGITSSWDGNAYTTYGDLSRTDGQPWNRAVKGQIFDVNGALTPKRFSQSLSDATFGERPKFGLGTPTLLVYIEDRFQPQQRFNDNKPDIGFPYITYHGIPLVETRYCPGSAISASSATAGDPYAYEFVRYTSTRPGMTPLTAYPTVTGETFFWGNDNDAHSHIYTADHPVMKMGFDDFVPDPLTDQLVGKMRFGWCMFSREARVWSQLKRITM